MMMANIKVSVNNDATNEKDCVFESQINNRSNEVAQDDYKNSVMESLDVALGMIKEGK